MDIINVINSKNVPKWGNQKKYIAIHYLGVDGQNNKVDAGGYGAHFYIYWDGTTYQAADLDAILWQVGTGGYYTQKHPKARNSNTIGIEMCCHCDGDASKAGADWWFTQETQKACVELARYLMDKLNIPPENVIRHYDIVNKTCPAPYVHNNRYRGTWTWNEFKQRIRSGSQPETPESKPDQKEHWYRIRKTWKDAGNQIGAYKNLENAKKACPAGYSVFDWKGNVVYDHGKVSAYPYVAKCTGNSVNVRKGPGMGYGNISGWPKLNKGNLVDVLGKEGAWYKIRIAGKYQGYISEDYLQKA